MKKIWKAVGLTAGILCTVGLICVGASVFLGGTLESLYQNEAAAYALDKLSLQSIVLSLATLFGF
jgi:hypothetical protein